MKVLIWGGTGYLGFNLARLFSARYPGCIFASFRRADGKARLQAIGCQPVDANDAALPVSLKNRFDLIINCAKAHWSEFSTEQVAAQERETLKLLDQLATKNAVKIHTSGIWLFAKQVGRVDVNHFMPLAISHPDVQTLQGPSARSWVQVFLPSYIYGGVNCQLKRCIKEWSDSGCHYIEGNRNRVSVIHVDDVASYYLFLHKKRLGAGRFTPYEHRVYSSEELYDQLFKLGVVGELKAHSLDSFRKDFGQDWLDVELIEAEFEQPADWQAKHNLAAYLAAEQTKEQV